MHKCIKVLFHVYVGKWVHIFNNMLQNSNMIKPDYIKWGLYKYIIIVSVHTCTWYIAFSYSTMQHNYVKPMDIMTLPQIEHQIIYSV